MKLCPRCDQAMPDIASLCPHCGHEMPEDEEFNRLVRDRPNYPHPNVAYGSFAQFSLEIWAIFAFLAILVSLAFALFAVLKGEWLSVFLSVLSAWGNFAFYALLRRVADLDEG